MRVCVYLKIITPKGKQDYVKRIIEKARLWQKKKRKRVENERGGERNREGGFGIKLKVERKKKGEDEIYGNTRVEQKKQEKKRRRRKHMDEIMEILLQYFYNIFIINLK